MIYLIRHGQTEFNREGRMQGRLDSPLTELGVEQARRMGGHLRARLDDPALWSIISSPLGRARRTAEIVRETLGLDCAIEFDDRLAEIHVGAWEGLTRTEIEVVAPGVHGTPGWIFKAPGGESRDDVAARVGGWLHELEQTDGRRRVVVSHGLAGGVLRELYAGGTLEQARPPQDAVFRLYRGAVERIDEPPAPITQAGA